MGNASKRKPRAPGGAPRPPTPPPRFAIVRAEHTGAVAKIDIYNLDHVVHVVSHVYGEERAIELWTLGPDPIVITGKPAADMLAHFILCGIDVEGAPAALASSRGEMYAPYIEPPPAEPVEPADPADEEIGECSECLFNTEAADKCPGWKRDTSGACENYRPIECEGCENENEHSCPGWIASEPSGDSCAAYKASPAEIYRRRAWVADECEREAAEIDSGKYATDTEENGPRKTPADAAELRDVARKIREEIAKGEPLPPRAIGEIRAGSVHEEPPTLNANAAKQWEATRASCAFGENCKRFPACGDCSLYALDRACAAAHDGDPLTIDGDRRVVHVEHVEQVSGATSAALLARVERCGVFVGLKGRGVVPGDLWCGVGHEMTDPACALCPYLRIYAPPL